MAAVLLATCAELPGGDEDADLLTDALATRGVDARWVAWTDPSVDWSSGLVVLRSTWDYTASRETFVRWVTGLDRVANAAEVVLWNTDKVYLRDLASAGVPVVATTFAAPGEPAVFAPEVAEFVVKPSVGAGSRGVGRFTADRLHDAHDHVAGLHDARRTVLVQPYLEEIDTVGETGLIYVDGVFSHAVRKAPMLPDGVAHTLSGAELFVEERITPRVASFEELDVGEAAMRVVRERFGTDQLYARVDLLPSDDGPVLVELELTEPSLFLMYGGDTNPAETFAEAIAGRVGQRSGRNSHSS